MLGIMAFVVMYFVIASHHSLLSSRLLFSGIIAVYLTAGVIQILKKGNCQPNCEKKFTKFENNFYCLYDNPKTMIRWFWFRLVVGAIAAVSFIFFHEQILIWLTY